MDSSGDLTELRRGVLGPCVLALLAERPRFGLEIVRDLATADGPLTSEGTVYPLLSRLRNAGFVTSTWRDEAGARARRYYAITARGRGELDQFGAAWRRFAKTVDGVLSMAPDAARGGGE